VGSKARIDESHRTTTGRAGMKPPTGRATTYLDFGMTQGGRRTSYDYYEGQPAYDLFMGARYLNDLIAYRTGNVDAVHHPEDLRDNLRKHTALTVCAPDSPRLTYFEIGSSVFGVIDALNYLDRKYAELNTAAIAWHGVDNSNFMNRMASYTHEGYDIHVAATVSPVPCDLLFAKGVSLLYAVDSEALFGDVLANSRIAIFDYTFSRGQRITDVVGTGLPVTFLSLDECRRRLTTTGKRLILEPYTIKSYHQSPDKVTYDCIYGESELTDRYVKELERRTRTFQQDWQRPLLRSSA
jgi:hypothetical protein